MNIPAELLENGTNGTNLFIRCLHGKEIPTEWKISWISTKHMTGDSKVSDNYQRFSVTSTISRLYGTILKNEIEKAFHAVSQEKL